MTGHPHASVRQLGYVGLDCSDLERWVDFVGHLGAEVFTDAGIASVRLDQERPYRVLLHAAAVDGIAYVGWEASGPQDFDQLVRRLDDAGAEPTVRDDLAESRRTQALVRFTDPDGVIGELYWGMASAAADRFVSPHDVRFSSDATGFGHITVSTRRYQVVRDFYLHVLGLRVSDVFVGSGLRAAFLRCNPRHHSLALLDRPSEPQELRHIMFDFKELDDLGHVRDLLVRGGFRINRDLGRHATDGVVSYYSASPAAFEVELGTGTYQVEDATWEEARFTRSTRAWGHRPAAVDPESVVT